MNPTDSPLETLAEFLLGSDLLFCALLDAKGIIGAHSPGVPRLLHRTNDDCLTRPPTLHLTESDGEQLLRRLAGNGKTRPMAPRSPHDGTVPRPQKRTCRPTPRLTAGHRRTGRHGFPAPPGGRGCRLSSRLSRRGRAVITGVQGELHQVGANMVADLLEADGWDVRFLGTNMPLDDILKTAREHQADLLGISATMLFNLPQVVQLVERTRAELGSAAPRVILGGGAFRLLPELPAELKVAAVATELRQGVELARSLQR